MVILEALNTGLSTSQKRILIVEDELLMGLLLDDMLCELGYKVADTACNIDDATEKIISGSFDAAILDVNLNGQRTFQLADKLHEKNIPFLFSTGYMRDSLPKGYQHHLVLQKPYDLTQLSSRLKEALSA